MLNLRRLLSLLFVAAVAALCSSEAQASPNTILQGPRLNPASGPTIDTGIGGTSQTDTAAITVQAPARSRDPGNNQQPEPIEAGDTTTGPPDPCFYLPQSPDKARAAGHDPATGTLYEAHCPVSSLLPGLPDGLRWAIRQTWAPTGQAPTAPPPDPLELAQSAAAQLTVPAPVVHLGPDQGKVAVKVPVWLWVDQQPPLQASVSAGGLTVNATASMTSTDWTMGEPVDDRAPGSRVPPFTCTGGGSAPPASYDRTTAPPCGYTYSWRSTAARTNGVSAWRVTTVAHWTVHWVATNGANGDIPLQATSNTDVRVGEWRASLVAGDAAVEPTR
jgi:hypothetical protein